jgi:hypothetical protein
MTIQQKIQANTVNGICVDDVQALIAGVAAKPAAGATHWRVASSWREAMHSQAHVDGFAIGGQTVQRQFAFDVDEPLQLAGANAYANPQEYLLGALNACLIAGFTVLCAMHGYRLDSLAVVTEGDIDLRGFLGLDTSVSPGYDALKTTLTVKGSASAEEFRTIFDIALATSPNVHNLTRPIALTSSLEVIAG